MDKPEIVKLTKMERFMLSNQLRILEKLYPEEASSIAQSRTAIEEGYALHYGWMLEGIYDELPAEECRFVLDTLAMHNAMLQAFPDGVPDDMRSKIAFRGFDGNNETEYLGYVRYFIDQLGRYGQLKEMTDAHAFRGFNSHMPMRGKYRRMLEQWRMAADPYVLTRADVEAILQA